MTEKPYILKHGKHGKYIEDKYTIFRAGQTVLLSESEYKSFKNKFEPAVYMPEKSTPVLEEESSFDLPKNWRDLPAAEKKKLASKIEGEKISKVDEANEILESYEKENVS